MVHPTKHTAHWLWVADGKQRPPLGTVADKPAPPVTEPGALRVRCSEWFLYLSIPEAGYQLLLYVLKVSLQATIFGSTTLGRRQQYSP